ncbi:MAG: UDP-N-acetylmuramoyl-L-alanine--D-glutamate ligase, partial [Variovorax sp.]
KPLVWIAGGVDKGNDYSIIHDQVKQRVRVLICLGKDNGKLKHYFKGVVPQIFETQNVQELVHIALDTANAGDVVLLSPACASFDMFRNYPHRAEVFRAAVQALADETGAMLDGSTE